MVSFGRPYAGRICSIFPLWMESKALVKSTNSNVTCRFFARTSSRILQIRQQGRGLIIILWYILPNKSHIDYFSFSTYTYKKVKISVYLIRILIGWESWQFWWMMYRVSKKKLTSFHRSIILAVLVEAISKTDLDFIFDGRGEYVLISRRTCQRDGLGVMEMKGVFL